MWTYSSRVALISNCQNIPTALCVEVEAVEEFGRWQDVARLSVVVVVGVACTLNAPPCGGARAGKNCQAPCRLGSRFQEQVLQPTNPQMTQKNFKLSADLGEFIDHVTSLLAEHSQTHFF